MKKVIVVGGGAAGMIAAGRAAQRKMEVHLYEKNPRLGKKILITGKGRCNFTNQCDEETLLENTPGNPYFLYSAFYSFNTEQTIQFFQKLGVESKVERGNRVFPVSDQAKDIADALEAYMRNYHVAIHLNQSVTGLIIENGKVTGIKLGKTKVSADAVIIATGGLSYPGTGSTGDGYAFAKECGHTVTKLYPSLVPLRAKEKWCSQLMGLSLKNVAISLKNKDGKIIYKDFGEMLFTHYGVSGPIILSASRHLIGQLEGLNLHIDLKPALEEKALDMRVLRDFEKYSNKDFKNSLDELLPQKLIPVIISLSGILETKKVREITKEERKRLVQLLKNLTLTIIGPVGFQEAVITSGGVETDEINPSTMESKLIKNLYFAGEVLDVDAYTGGFNLQIAFSTGFLAGEHILKDNME